MKPSTVINIITAFGLSSAVTALKVSEADAKAICGDLGVMDTSNLPDGVDPDAVRTCKEHPAGTHEQPDKRQETLEERSCWFGDHLGCSNSGFCYKSCAQPGSGEWCWTAKNNGFGDWVTCSSRNDCSTSDQCGAGDCSACGCSC